MNSDDGAAPIGATRCPVCGWHNGSHDMSCSGLKAYFHLVLEHLKQPGAIDGPGDERLYYELDQLWAHLSYDDKHKARAWLEEHQGAPLHRTLRKPPPKARTRRGVTRVSLVGEARVFVFDLYPRLDFSPKPSYEALENAFVGGLAPYEFGVLMTRERVTLGMRSPSYTQGAVVYRCDPVAFLPVDADDDGLDAEPLIELVRERLTRLARGTESFPAPDSIQAVLVAALRAEFTCSLRALQYG